MKYFACILCGLLCAAAGGALTLEQAKDMAVMRNPELAAYREKKNAADWQVAQAWTGLFPSGQITGSYNRYDPAYTGFNGVQEESRSFGISLNQTLYAGGKVRLGIKTNKELARQTDLGLEQKLLEVLAGAESRYYTLLEQADLLIAAQKDVELSKELLKSARIRYDTGTLSRADLLHVQSQLAAKEVALIQTRNSVDVSRIDLATYIKAEEAVTPESIPFTLYQPCIDQLEGLEQPAVEAIYDKLIDFAAQESPMVQLAKSGEQLQTLNLKLARANFLPGVNLSYAKNWNRTDLQDAYQDQGTLSLSVSIPLLPLYDTFAGVKKAEADLRSSRFERVAAEDGLQQSVKQLFYNLIAAARSVLSARLARDYAEETFQQMRIRFRNRVIAANDLLDAEILYISAQNQYTQSFYGFLRAKSQLMQTMGIQEESSFWRFIPCTN